MDTSVIWYLKEFARGEWVKKFFYVKTAPLVAPDYFRDYPAITDKECTQCLSCMMICPTPDAIEIIKTKDGKWEPRISKGHCLRCGLCVEVCPEGVLTCGRILERQERDRTVFVSEFHINVDDSKCQRCGNCSVACPVNKVEDPKLAASGMPSNNESIMAVRGGRLVVSHEEKCKGCKTCEETCPNGAITVARMISGAHDREEDS